MHRRSALRAVLEYGSAAAIGYRNPLIYLCTVEARLKRTPVNTDNGPTCSAQSTDSQRNLNLGNADTSLSTAGSIKPFLFEGKKFFS